MPLAQAYGEPEPEVARTLPSFFRPGRNEQRTAQLVVGFPFERRGEMLRVADDGMPEAPLAEKRERIGVFARPEEPEHVGERTLAAALVPDDRDQPRIELDGTTEPLFACRGVGPALKGDAANVFRGILFDAELLRRPTAEEDAASRLA